MEIDFQKPQTDWFRYYSGQQHKQGVMLGYDAEAFDKTLKEGRVTSKPFAQKTVDQRRRVGQLP